MTQNFHFGLKFLLIIISFVINNVVYAEAQYSVTIHNNTTDPISITVGSETSCIKLDKFVLPKDNSNTGSFPLRIDAGQYESFKFSDSNHVGGCVSADKNLRLIISSLAVKNSEKNKLTLELAHSDIILSSSSSSGVPNIQDWASGIIQQNESKEGDLQVDNGVCEDKEYNKKGCFKIYDGKFDDNNGSDYKKWKIKNAPDFFQPMHDGYSYEFDVSASGSIPQNVKFVSIGLGNLIITNGYGKEVDTSKGLDFSQAPFYFHFTKTTQSCYFGVNHLTCDPGVGYKYLAGNDQTKDDDVIVFVCSQKTPGQGQCPWVEKDVSVKGVFWDSKSSLIGQVI